MAKVEQLDDHMKELTQAETRLLETIEEFRKKLPSVHVNLTTILKTIKEGAEIFDAVKEHIDKGM